MKKATWKAKIKAATEEAGTYRPYFKHIIDTLAGIMEMRDDALKRFEESGGETVVLQYNVKGNAYLAKNPALVVVDDLNKTALQYWRDLGLTPAGLKRIDDQAMKGHKKNELAEALAALEHDE